MEKYLSAQHKKLEKKVNSLGRRKQAGKLDRVFHSNGSH
jgi:hypothetical protein